MRKKPEKKRKKTQERLLSQRRPRERSQFDNLQPCGGRKKKAKLDKRNTTQTICESHLPTNALHNTYVQESHYTQEKSAHSVQTRVAQGQTKLLHCHTHTNTN